MARGVAPDCHRGSPDGAHQGCFWHGSAWEPWRKFGGVADVLPLLLHACRADRRRRIHLHLIGDSLMRQLFLTLRHLRRFYAGRQRQPTSTLDVLDAIEQHGLSNLHAELLGEATAKGNCENGTVNRCDLAYEDDGMRLSWSAMVGCNPYKHVSPVPRRPPASERRDCEDPGWASAALDSHELASADAVLFNYAAWSFNGVHNLEHVVRSLATQLPWRVAAHVPIFYLGVPYANESAHQWQQIVLEPRHHFAALAALGWNASRRSSTRPAGARVIPIAPYFMFARSGRWNAPHGKDAWLLQSGDNLHLSVRGDVAVLSFIAMHLEAAGSLPRIDAADAHAARCSGGGGGGGGRSRRRTV